MPGNQRESNQSRQQKGTKDPVPPNELLPVQVPQTLPLHVALDELKNRFATTWHSNVSRLFELQSSVGEERLRWTPYSKRSGERRSREDHPIEDSLSQLVQEQQRLATAYGMIDHIKKTMMEGNAASTVNIVEDTPPNLPKQPYSSQVSKINNY